MVFLGSKKIALIISFRDFRDEEYFVVKETLETAGIKVKTVSNERGIAIGADGGEADVDFTIREINLDNFGGIIFIGGPGAIEALDNERSHKLIMGAVNKNKILGAICISPVILARAGVLENRKATVWASALDKNSIKILQENKAEFVDEKAVQDEKIITGNGPGAAKEFAEMIIKALDE